MRRLGLETKGKISMDRSDILYVLELLKDAKIDKDWDIVEEAEETLKEFLDDDQPSDDE